MTKLLLLILLSIGLTLSRKTTQSSTTMSSTAKGWIPTKTTTAKGWHSTKSTTAKGWHPTKATKSTTVKGYYSTESTTTKSGTSSVTKSTSASNAVNWNSVVTAGKEKIKVRQ